MIALGELKTIDLRKIWPHEALDFTRWLAREDNIVKLCDELDISIEDIKVEEASGRYNADIVAIESNTKRTVIIENQLEITDHKHLGQILTYASAHDASIIIWNVKDYTEEHKQAIDWFNRNMPEQISFFLVQTELWQIGESLPAPKFNVISQPNNWAKTIKQGGLITKGSISDTKLIQQRFWSEFKKCVSQKMPPSPLNIGRTPRPQHWFDMTIGTSKAHLTATINTKDDKIGVELYIKSDGVLYNNLVAQKEMIENETGFSLTWMDLPESTAFRIAVFYSADPLIESRWLEYFQWIQEKAEKLFKVFKARVV
jgi:hypothetical protein